MLKRKLYDAGQKGTALFMALGITALCLSMSMHVLSMSLHQDETIHREWSAFQARQHQEKQRAVAHRTRYGHSLSEFLADKKITLKGWVPDRVEMDCNTGVFLYTVTAEATDSSTEPLLYHRWRYEPDMSVWLKAEKFKYQQKALWVDFLLVEGLKGNVNKTTIDKNAHWTALSDRLSTTPRIYALTTAGELRIYDLQFRLVQRYSLGAKMRAKISAAQSINLSPDAWQGYLLTHTIVASPVVRQILWIVLQHPECPDAMVWSVDISDPNAPLSDLNNSVSSACVLSEQHLSARPIAIMHPHHHRAGLVLAAERGGFSVVQWLERGKRKPEVWLDEPIEPRFWNRLMAIDRWQSGYPDRVYVFDTAGHIWKGDFFDDADKPLLDWDSLHDTPQPGVIEQVAAISGAGGSVDIVQQKRQNNQSMISIVSDDLTQGETIVYTSHAPAMFFIKSPHLWLFWEGTQEATLFSLGTWHRRKHLMLDAFLPRKDSMVTTLLQWSPQRQNFIWRGLNNYLCEKTVKIQDEYANLMTE